MLKKNITSPSWNYFVVMTNYFVKKITHDISLKWHNRENDIKFRERHIITWKCHISCVRRIISNKIPFISCNQILSRKNNIFREKCIVFRAYVIFYHEIDIIIILQETYLIAFLILNIRTDCNIVNFMHQISRGHLNF